MWESFFHLNEQALGLRHFSETYLFVVIIEAEGEGSDAGRECQIQSSTKITWLLVVILTFA